MSVHLARTVTRLPSAHIAAPSPPVAVCFLHPLLGNSKCWEGTISALKSNRLETPRQREWTAINVDLRNHGHSPFPGNHTYDFMLEDLHQMLRTEIGHTPVHLVGHSMGGRLAMRYALEMSQEVAGLFVVDALPMTYTHNHDHMFHAMRSLELRSFGRRSDVQLALEAGGLSRSEAVYCLLSLDSSATPFQWRVNLEALHGNRDVFEWPQFAFSPFQGHAHFLGGSQGRLALPGQAEAIATLFPASHVTVLQGGHFVHNEHPKAFRKLLVQSVEHSVAAP